MQLFNRSGLWAALIAAFIAMACEDPPPPEAAQPLTSRVELAAGNVWLVDGSDKTRLITGAMLEENATLSVEDGGRALVRLDSGAATFLRSATTATISEGGVRLEKGELWADVPAGEEEMGRFSAGETTVSASDAGLDIAFDGSAVHVYVARGLAVVTGPGGRAEVQSGEQVTVAGKTPLEVAPVAFWEDWTGGMADRATSTGIGGQASGRIYGIDRASPGALPSELQITAQSVRVGIKDGVAHTVVDQRFFNPGSTPLEGWYWFTVPEGASVERFALEVNGALVEGEMVERKQAKAAYEEAIQKAFDPALLEWVDGRTFRARIFPIPAAGERRVVLSYFELLPLSDGAYRYTYPMASAGETTIQEFSLTVELGKAGKDYEIRTLQDAKVAKDKSSISMRRSGFQPKADFLLELRMKDEKSEAPLRVMRYSTGKAEADYLMMRYSPEVDWEALKKVPGDVVVVLDTSAGGDDADRQIRADAVEAILRALSKGDRFAVMATDLNPRIVFPKKGLADATEENVSLAVEKLSEIPSAGATDLGEMFSKALDLLHDANQPAVVYVGDGLATVGETSSLALADRLRRALGDSRARLFTIAVGSDANVSLLHRLARIGGGRSFSISRSEQTVQEALHFVGLVKTPTLTELHIDVGKGLDQVFASRSGKLSKGDEMILLARTHHALPDTLVIKGRLGEQTFEKTYTPDEAEGREYGYIPLLWARQYLTRLMGDGLEEKRGRIISLGLNYSMMTPFSSFLVLESDQAYRDQGIQRRNRYRFSDNEVEEEQRLAVARDSALSIPFGLFGCTSESKAPDQQEMAVRVKGVPKKEMSGQDAPEEPPSPMNHSSLEKSAENEEGAAVADDEAKAAPAPRSKSSARRETSRSERKSGEEFLLGPVGGLGTKKKGGGSGTGYGKRHNKRAPGGKRAAGVRKSMDKDRPSLIASGALSTPSSPAKDIFQKGVCSDASRRSLPQRRILWIHRLARATGADQFKRIFFEAGKRCELERWRDRKVMLDLIERQVTTPGQVAGILNTFEGHPRILSYLRKKIMRRALDPEMTMGLFFPGMPNWRVVSTGLAAIADPLERLKELRAIIAKHPDDPRGKELLIDLLVELNRTDKAIREAERLRREGLAAPRVLEVLCDLQAAAGYTKDAKRTCSELVEFNADDPNARKRLGDIFLRHGWYDAAYRQYATLAAMQSDNPLALLRLAAAAAGMGKIDEALRIERRVASGDGEPGPYDPRRFARLHSAARLAQMLMAARKDANTPKSKLRAIERSLKQTQVFGGESTIVLLVWEDLQAPLQLLPKVGETLFTVSEMVQSEETGLMMIDIGKNPPNALGLFVNARDNRVRRKVPFKLLTISWDGKAFSIEEKSDSLDPQQQIV